MTNKTWQCCILWKSRCGEEGSNTMIFQVCFEIEVSNSTFRPKRKKWTKRGSNCVKRKPYIVLRGTIWWKVCEIGFGTEYDWKIDFEVKWIGEWWIIESRGRVEDTSMGIVMSEVVIRRGLEQELNEPNCKQMNVVRYR